MSHNNWSALSEAADNITITVTNAGSVDQLNTIAGRTSAANITLDSTITDDLYNFIQTADNSSNTTKFAKVLSHTTNEPIVLNSYTVTSNNNVTAINALLAAAEAGVTGTITDDNGSELLNTTVDLTTTTDDSITVDVGTVNPTADNLAELKKLADQAGITRINGDLTISAADVDTIAGYNNLTTSNNYINFVLDTSVSVSQAATIAGKTSGTVAYDAGISDSLSAFASASARTTNFNNALAKDDTVDITVTGTQTTADHISALNLIVAGQ